MSEKINDGGPAFPQIETSASTEEIAGERQVFGNTYSHGGMSLRDYFAAAAMLTAWSDLARDEDAKVGITVGENKLEPGEHVYTYSLFVAKRAYEIADAMLAVRNGGGS